MWLHNLLFKILFMRTVHIQHAITAKLERERNLPKLFFRLAHYHWLGLVPCCYASRLFPSFFLKPSPRLFIFLYFFSVFSLKNKSVPLSLLPPFTSPFIISLFHQLFLLLHSLFESVFLKCWCLFSVSWWHICLSMLQPFIDLFVFLSFLYDVYIFLSHFWE